MGIQSDPEEEEKPEEYNIVKEYNKINPEVGDEEALENASGNYDGDGGGRRLRGVERGNGGEEREREDDDEAEEDEFSPLEGVDHVGRRRRRSRMEWE